MVPPPAAGLAVVSIRRAARGNGRGADVRIWLGIAFLGALLVAGAALGIMVTLTSVGAGALGATLLLLLYPLRMRLQKLIATDIVHAVPLTLVAGIGHLWIGNFNGMLLLNLLIGSIPGIIIGSMLASKVPEKVLQPLLAVVLIIAGWRLIA